MSQEQEVKKEENTSFFKKYSPVIDLVASTALSFGTSLYFNGTKSLFAPLLLAPAKVVADTVSGYVDNKLFTTFVDNFSGTAALYLVKDEKIRDKFGAEIRNDAAQVKLKWDGVTPCKAATPITKAIAYGLVGIGEGAVISQVADALKGQFNTTADHYSFDNTLVTLRFGTYFALKTFLTGSVFTNGSNAASAVSGMISGLVSKNLMNSANYLLNDKDAGFNATAIFKDSVAMFVNSYLYGVHDNNIGYANGLAANIAIDMGIETIDTVLKKDILGNNKDEAIIPALYSLSNAIKDGLSTFSENFFKPSENDYDPDPLIQLDNGHYDYCSV